MTVTRAPVALFVFNRPDHLRRTIESLTRCDGFADSPVVVFADGAPADNDTSAVEATRSVARELLGERAEYHLSPVNRGLARSIIDGVELLLSRYGRVIVVEDDLTLAPGFLRFLNDALDHYIDDERVYQVSGHMFDVREFAQRREALLLPLTTTWGWATWARAWRYFDPQAHGWKALRSDRRLRRRFNLDGAYDYAHMLEQQVKLQRHSWGIRWYWSVFSRNGLGCFPPRSLVTNHGMDRSGTHGSGALREFGDRALSNAPLPFIAQSGSSPEPDALRALQRAVWRQNGGWLGAAVDWSRRISVRLTGLA